MTALDDKLRPKVKALIAKYGRNVAFLGKPTAYVVGAGSTTAPASLGTVKAVVGPYEQRYVDGTNIKATDLRLIIAAEDSDVTPETGQIVTVDSRQLKVVAVKPYSSGEQNAAWEVQVRA